MHYRTGKRVVVLVDEYDKPTLDALREPEVATANRDFLRGLYATIKDSDEHIRFVLLTGVSKFSKVSLFSGLNNLNEITLDSRYSSVCGYTDADLDTVFAPELDGLDRGRVREWYNGYSWLGPMHPIVDGRQISSMELMDLPKTCTSLVACTHGYGASR